MYKILATDGISKEGAKVFEDADFQLDQKKGLKPEDIISIIGEYDALVVRSETKPDAAMMDAAKSLKVIGRAGVGTDNIKIDEATKRGIIVMNTPDGNTNSAAEQTVFLMGALYRNLAQADASMKSGAWNRSKFNGNEVYGKTLGLIGLGNIGKKVAKVANALEMTVIASDPALTKEKAAELGVELVSQDELYKRADIISPHVPLTDGTKYMINKDTIAMMKDGVSILNVARGGVINESDLADAIESGKVSGAALDVYEKEKVFKNTDLKGLDTGTIEKQGEARKALLEDRLVQSKKVICAPHLGASTEEAQVNVGVDVARQIVNYLNTGKIENAINAKVEEAAMPYLQLSRNLGKLAAVLADGIPKPKIEVSFSGSIADIKGDALSNSALEGILSKSVVGVNIVNAPLYANERGLKVEPSYKPGSEDSIGIKIETDKGVVELSGNLAENGMPRTYIINGVDNRFEPLGNLLFVDYLDNKGVNWRVEKCISDADINIENVNNRHYKNSKGKDCVQYVIRTNNVIPESVVKTIESTLKSEVPGIELYNIKSMKLD